MTRADAAPRRGESPGWGEAAFGLGCHAAAVVVIAYLAAIGVAGRGVVAEFFVADGGELVRRNAWLVAGHVGAAALVWGSIVALIRVASRVSVRRVARRGQVAVETLVVIMPMLMIILGMVQLALNNVAAMLTDLAAYQAGRAAWIWQFEGERHDGSEMSGDDGAILIRKARLAAASALAPAAPSSFSFSGVATDPELVALRASMFAYFDPSGSSGSQSTDAASSAVNAGGMSSGNGASGLRLDAAFDNTGMSQRAARKLTFAYAATSVEVVPSESQISTRVTYKHYLSVPIFGSMFSDTKDPVAGLAGSYAVITRTYSVAPQIGVRRAPWASQ